MDWISIEKSNYLSADIMNAIYHNMQIINSLLPSLSLNSVTLQDSSVTYNISPAEILIKMKAVENNIDDIHHQLVNMSGWKEKYYQDFIWKHNTANKKKEVDRWIDWLNDVYFMLKNTTIKEDALTDKNGESITDISGEQIYTKERIFADGKL